MTADTRAVDQTYRTEGCPLLWVGNFEVEEIWAEGETQLPRLTSRAGSAVVSRMDEFALWMASTGDTVLLKDEPDPDFLRHLTGLTGQRPHVLALRAADRDGLVSRVALDLADDLAVDLPEGTALVAHGVSPVETALAERWGIEVAAPPVDVVRRVNSKVYSRRLADRLGIRQPEGFACDSPLQWDELVATGRRLLGHGRPVVMKEAYGVSGKGLAVVEDEARLDRLAARVARSAERNAGPMAFTIEQWVDKDCDLNYQFSVGRDGQVRLDFIKQAVTKRRVHAGHLIPADLPTQHVEVLTTTAQALGEALHADGFWGVVGVDALTERDGGLHPMLEINARFNMSTYQLPAQTALDAVDGPALAKHYEFRSDRLIGFAELAERLGDLLAGPGAEEGVVVLNHATVNAAHAVVEPGKEVAGRLYVLLVARSVDRLPELDNATRHALGLAMTPDEES